MATALHELKCRTRMQLVALRKHSERCPMMPMLRAGASCGAGLSRLSPTPSILHPTQRPRGLSKCVISRVISTLNGVSTVATLRITY